MNLIEQVAWGMRSKKKENGEIRVWDENEAEKTRNT